MLSQIFIELPNHLESTIIRDRRVRWFVHTVQYTGSIKNTIYFFLFPLDTLNKYLFFPYFHFVSMFLTNI